jgi:glycosyltransferase involved in cell wall biosynthesis
VDPAARGLIRRNKHLPSAWWALLRLRRAGTVAHVHVSQRGSLLREGSLLVTARLLGIKSIVTVHGSSTAAQGPLARALMGTVIRQASAVHVLSETHRERLDIGRPRGQSVLVAENDSAVPDAVPPLPERSKTFLFGGRIGFRKGVDVLLTAWRVAETDGWRLVLAGPVDDDFREILTNAQALDDSIVWLGPVAPERVLEQLLAAQVAILPSRAEAMPMFLVEASAAGCAVIGTSVGGVPELLGHGRYGLVAAPDDAAALTRCINDLVRDEPLRSSLGAAGRRRAIAQAAEVSRQWATAYRALAQDSRGTRRRSG